MANVSETGYGGRPYPSTVAPAAKIIVGLFQQKDVVTFKDMQKATGRKWVRGYLSGARDMRPNIVPVKEGRKLLGFTMQRGRRPAATIIKTAAQTSNVVDIENFRVPKGFKLVPVKRGRPAKD